MGQLEKALLQEVKSDARSTAVGDPVPVQFNPASLKLNLTNRLEGGRSHGRQTRQYVGSSSTTVQLELIFDTADEGTTDTPRSVLERTEIIERFIKPKRQRNRSSNKPPKLSFQWGNLIIVGMVESIDLELDHFAANGVPLRAKANVSIKQQTVEFQFEEGDEERGNAPSPGEPSSAAPGADSNSPATPGTAPATNQSADALGDETLPEFAARQGLDPAAWRGLDPGVDLSAGLTLQAGLEVGFNANLSASAGLGVTVGVAAGVDASLEASFGLQAGASVQAGFAASARARMSAGFALAAAGGIGAAVESVQIVKSSTADQATREAFNAPPAKANSAAVHSPATNLNTLPARAAGPTLQPGLPQQKRTPLAQLNVDLSALQPAEPAPLPPQADKRAFSYGFGVPLRPRVAGALDHRRGLVVGGGAIVVQASQPAGIPYTDNPTIPAWEQLPRLDNGRAVADQIQNRRQGTKSCGCTGPCHHH